MLNTRFLLPLILFLISFFTLNAFSKQPKSFRTFITLKAYHLDQSGNSSPDQTVQLKVNLKEKQEHLLPQAEQSWTLKNGTTQNIDKTFEIPFEALSSDSFSFEIQVVRNGKTIDPCRFTVTQISQYNRKYVCRTDVNHQLQKQNISEEKLSKEAVEVRVFTDLKTARREIPRQVIAFKK